MDYVKATIQYAMTNPQDENKKRYLNDDEGIIDTTPLDIPRPISTSHPLVRNLSMHQILLSIQKDIKELEKSEYSKVVQRSQTKGSGAAAAEVKSSTQLVDEVKKKNDLYPKKTIVSPQRSKQKIEASSSVAILGNYVKNPKEIPKESSEQQSGTKLPKKLPSARIRERPIKRLDRGLLMFKEIFVHPKETKLEELHKREKMEAEQNPNQKVECLTERQDLATKKLLGALKTTPRGKSSDDKELKEMMEEPEVTEEKDQSEAQVDEVVDIVMRMFNSKLKGRTGEGFFSQQIQVQPPEGLNATVAAPLTPGGGWAPSIPGSTGSLSKISFKVHSNLTL